MGAAFGYFPESGFNLYFHPEVTPGPNEKPTFDPLLGFENGRKERVMLATEEEMRSAKIPPEHRDYCAHHLLKYLSCRKDNWPWAVNCEHEKHVYSHCKYEDYVIRMKEYERERRLRVREFNKKQHEIAAA
ncbi:NADH dehydrogenase [ubiquinone] 1 beta subcomplex subunit 7 [Tribolium madens]|uniref:NADH dehydrogenase [ubiquinone] 1 beta subcomplex subunit 7 n=1 Tax=Tribolium madens TaxID=41895 RepID=UPI001CF720AF|nr:NADH dehydrogenase [ubiquinone] 1 beta subcomplex subunit 7 [Tribolium madens]